MSSISKVVPVGVVKLELVVASINGPGASFKMGVVKLGLVASNKA